MPGHRPVCPSCRRQPVAPGEGLCFICIDAEMDAMVQQAEREEDERVAKWKMERDERLMGREGWGR